MRQFTLLLTTTLFSNALNIETKLTPDELEVKNQASISFIDTLSLKAGHTTSSRDICY